MDRRACIKTGAESKLESWGFVSRLCCGCARENVRSKRRALQRIYVGGGVLLLHGRIVRRNCGDNPESQYVNEF